MRFGKITVACRSAMHSELSRLTVFFQLLEGHTLHRRANEPFHFALRFAVVADPAALRRAVERMNRLAEFFSKLPCNIQRQRRARRDAQTQSAQPRQVTHFAERLE